MIFTAIAAVGKFLMGGFLDKVVSLGETYIKNETDRAQFKKEVQIAGQEAAVKMEEAWAQAASEATKAANATVATSPVLQRAWATVMFLQLVVLLWYQIGTSCYQVITGTPWPTPMADIEWAYLLIGAMIGAGPLVFRRGSPK
jgi:hypothetical protein